MTLCRNSFALAREVVARPSVPLKQHIGVTSAFAPLNGFVSHKRLFSQAGSMPPPIDTSHRHTGIHMHPESIGNLIMPGNVVLKTVRQFQAQLTGGFGRHNLMPGSII